MNRRTTLGCLVAGLCAGLAPFRAFAAWNQSAMKSAAQSEAIAAVFGTDATIESSELMLKAPEIAENGAVVPLEVRTELPAERIAIFVEKNPLPLAINVQLADNSAGLVKTRVRMGETSTVTAVALVDGQVLSASQEVKVTIGGCGG